MECSLHPEDIPPPAWVGIRDASCTKTSNSTIGSVKNSKSGSGVAYSPPRAPPMNANPFASARYFKGRISEGIAWTIEMVASVTPIRMPPPISIFIEVAFAQITAPTKAIRGGIDAIYFLSRTSERRPTIGDSALCMSKGPYIASEGIR